MGLLAALLPKARYETGIPLAAATRTFGWSAALRQRGLYLGQRRGRIDARAAIAQSYSMYDKV